VQRIVVQAAPLILHLVGRPIVRPLEVNYARLCLPYAMAVALRRGVVTLADFTPEALKDEETHALAGRIELAPLDIADPAAFVPQRASAYLRDGARVEVGVTALPGSSTRPLTREEQVAKLSANFEFGLGDQAQDRAQRLAQLCDGLETVPDVSVLSRIVACAGRS
jgi:2-methylcitrate dehydratase PrpD